MTTSIKVRTNGNYVAEVKNSSGAVLGKAGPGSNVESDWIWISHGEEVSIAERTATAEEVEAVAQAQQSTKGTP